MNPDGCFFEFAFDHLDDQIVGNQLAALHVALGLLAEFRARDAVLAQDVAGRNLLRAEALLQNLAPAFLCPLPVVRGR